LTFEKRNRWEERKEGETEKGRRAEQRRQRKPRKIQTTKAASKHEGIHSMEEESISF
jgi:hypothetical protein